MHSFWAVWYVRDWKQHTGQNSKTQPSEWSDAGHWDVFPSEMWIFTLHSYPHTFEGSLPRSCLPHMSDFLPSSGVQTALYLMMLSTILDCGLMPLIWVTPQQDTCVFALRFWLLWHEYTCGVCTWCCVCFLFSVLLAWECNCSELVFLAVCTGEFPFLEPRFITTSLFLSCLLMCFLKGTWPSRNPVSPGVLNHPLKQYWLSLTPAVWMTFHYWQLTEHKEDFSQGKHEYNSSYFHLCAFFLAFI